MARVKDAYWKIRAIELKQEENPQRNLLGPILYKLYMLLGQMRGYL